MSFIILNQRKPKPYQVTEEQQTVVPINVKNYIESFLFIAKLNLVIPNLIYLNQTIFHAKPNLIR